MGQIIKYTAISMSIFQLYTAYFGVFPAFIHRSVHLGFALILCFLLYPSGKNVEEKRQISVLDILLCLISFLAMLYIFSKNDYLITRIPYVISITQIEILLGALAVLVVLEATRRAVGVPLVIINILFLLIALNTEMLPGVFSHRSISIPRLLEELYITLGGIMGLPLGLSSTYIFMFILFGVFYQEFGGGKFLMDLGTSLLGTKRGGPAKIAVVASSLFGTMSGSSVANVVATGSFTIPLMKKIGYDPTFAAATEAAASTGGQIMPPVMGAAAFLLAQFTGISYIIVLKHAIIPAVLYYIALFLMIDMEAAKKGLMGLSKENIPDIRKVLRQGWMNFVPLLVILIILVRGYSPSKAAFWAIVSTFVTCLLRKDFKSIKNTLNVLEKGAKVAVPVAIVCASAGIIIGITSLTGLGLSFTSILTRLTGENLFFGLIVVAFAGLILGMGLPTSPAYIILAALASPALIELGLSIIQAHMFIFYFSLISSITPPVAVAAYAAAGIAECDPMQTGFTAMKLGITLYIIPFFFAFNPSIILIGEPVGIIMAVATSLIGIWALSCALQGWFVNRKITNWVIRVLLFSSALLLLGPGQITDRHGIVLFILVIGYMNFSNIRRRLKIKKN